MIEFVAKGKVRPESSLVFVSTWWMTMSLNSRTRWSRHIWLRFLYIWLPTVWWWNFLTKLILATGAQLFLIFGISIGCKIVYLAFGPLWSGVGLQIQHVDERRIAKRLCCKLVSWHQHYPHLLWWLGHFFLGLPASQSPGKCITDSFPTTAPFVNGNIDNYLCGELWDDGTKNVLESPSVWKFGATGHHLRKSCFK